MPKLKHIQLKEYPYMVTTNTTDRKPIFAKPDYADILLETILFGRQQEWYYLFAFVIMPEHIHLLLTPRNKTISECMKSIKGFSARRINKIDNTTGAVWQEGFYDYIIDSEEKILTRINYIEENPARKGLVSQAEDYKYSSRIYRNEIDFEMLFR